MPPFRPFAADHLGALAATGAVVAAAVWFARKSPVRAVVVGRVWAVFLLVAQLLNPVLLAHRGELTLQEGLPLDLCDLTSFFGAWALWTRTIPAFEFAYFWGLSGTLLAMATPPLAHGFPDPEFVHYFLVHSGGVGGVLFLLFGAGLRPRPGAALRVYGWTAAYAASVGLVNLALNANYFWLRAKPDNTVLDLFGDWPWYIAGAALLAAALFLLLGLPFRGSRDPHLG
ncbi:MAG: TIGR02206 family membrane protein [Planctomycetota bacterium]